METEPAQGLNESVSQEQKDHFRSEGSEEAIKACYDLISSGQPLSEILVALKRLGPLDKDRQSERGLGPIVTQISDIAGEVRAASPQWRTAQLTESLESRLLDQSQHLSAAWVRIGSDSSHSLVALRVRQPPESAPVENRLGIKVSRPIGAVLFWLIPAISLTAVGVAGKLLSDADLTWKVTEATAVPKAIPSTVEGTEDWIAPRAETAETRVPVPAISDGSRTGPEITPKRPAAPNSPPVTGRRRSAQPRQTPIQRPFSMEWKIPSRLTDGF
jgi:hypothetical protein